MQRIAQGAGETRANHQLWLIRHVIKLRLREQPIEGAPDVYFADAGLDDKRAQRGGTAETRPARRAGKGLVWTKFAPKHSALTPQREQDTRIVQADGIHNQASMGCRSQAIYQFEGEPSRVSDRVEARRRRRFTRPLTRLGAPR